MFLFPFERKSTLLDWQQINGVADKYNEWFNEFASYSIREWRSFQLINFFYCDLIKLWNNKRAANHTSWVDVFAFFWINIASSIVIH